MRGKGKFNSPTGMAGEGRGKGEKKKEIDKEDLFSHCGTGR